MKRKIALILTFLLIFTIALPIDGFAAEMDKELENAIKTAKSIFTVPEDYKFTSSISTSGAKKVYHLSWRSPDSVESASVNVTVDENGMILNYSKYSPYDYKQVKKLPGLSRQDAKAKADIWINKIAPDLLKELAYEESYQSSIMDYSYYLAYYRVVNGVPFYNNRVNVNINRDTGELQDYSRNWTDGIVFPPLKDTIDAKAAEDAYEKNLGLRLIYRFSYNDDIMKAYPVYVPIYDNSNYGVDALTGERHRLAYDYYFGGAGDGGAYITMEKAKVAAAAGVIQLSPEELQAVQDASKLISKDEAEKTARNAEFLDITDSYKLQSYYLNNNWPEKNKYSWSLQFNKPADDKTLYDEYINVTVNAQTGIITSFYAGNKSDRDARPKNDIAAAKAAVDAFLSQYYGQYSKQLEFDELSGESNIYREPQNTYYNFTYARLVNGVPFPENGITIGYDNLTGTISSFNLNWYDMAFPSTDKVIGLEAAGDILFRDVGLGLEYRNEFTENADKLILPVQPENTKVVLVYTLKPNKPLYIDAGSGALLNYDGTEYKAAEKVSYTDIEGNAAQKQITVLAENGIYLEGKEFKPDTAITQLDFLTLLSKTLNYYGPVITSKSAARDIDELYAYLQREGIIKAGERKPTQAVTREEAVKYIIRALKFDRVADINGIFNIGFKDKASISPDLTGYVAIAAGLGIIDGRSTDFRPKDKMTRGEAAIMIYNYLQS